MPYFRCYSKIEKKANFTPKPQPKPSESIVLAFDTETGTDQYQNMIFGSCGIWINGELSKFFVFYNDNLSKNDITLLEKSCQDFCCKVISNSEFINTIFYPYVFYSRAKCIGFNLPFDISRISKDFTKSRKFHNGFSFILSNNPKNPRIVIKSLDSKSSFIEFTKPLRKQSESNYTHFKGYFVDLKSFTFSLTNESYKLEKALTDFECPIKKIDADKHGIISKEYVGYNINDVLCTYYLYLEAKKRYSIYGLQKPENKLYSPASIGKAYLEKLNIVPFLDKNNTISDEMIGQIMMTYYGGRTETKIRKVPTKVSYIDFTSMYPTIFVLLGMNNFLISEQITPFDSTAETQKLLENILESDVAEKSLWPKLTTICEIVPDNDILPIREKYGDRKTANIGVNYLKSEDDSSAWYALPDIIGSKFATGKTPKIRKAITFHPKGTQQGLREIQVLPGISVKPENDFIKTIIEKRIQIKKDRSLEKNQAKLRQTILKIIANATSYGIFIQQDMIHHKKPQKIKVFGTDTFEITQTKTENPGKYFNPIMSVLLTAGSRLILSTVESIVSKNGGYLAYCDTDSVFISPNHVEMVQKFFESLNPYSEKVDMFKIEEDDKGISLHDIWCLSISAKRYVLYKPNNDMTDFEIYKYSTHGLGHLDGIDPISWWKDILSIIYHPELEKIILEKYKDKYAISSLTITSWDVYKRFEKFNENKPFSKKIKPFNFVTVGTGYKLDPQTGESIIPLLPKVNKSKYDEVPYMSFIDYKSGSIYPKSGSTDTKFYWKRLSHVFKDYLNHSEVKFDGSLGNMIRKHVGLNQDNIKHIGKEANDIEKSDILGVFDGDVTEYSNQQKKIRQVIENLTEEKSLELGISRRMFYYLKKKLQNKKKIVLYPNAIRKISQAFPYC